MRLPAGVRKLSDRQVIFLHIPKAGGSTLRTILQRQYRERGVYEIRDDINGDILRFCAGSEAERAATGLLMGHMGFGLHHFLPGPSVYLTMLRQPEKRVLSEFRFLQSNPYHVLHDAAKDLSLMQYLQSEMTGQISNGQTRLLCGATKDGQTGIPTRRRMEERDLQQALHNMEAY
ncbi:MAG: sulfotransferase family 2 domain-containing protein, partial [Pseudomonadota bacterium]|nr:sulfotransferase family 2 domain-containing protein [Pseudomonadota bacterium]